MFQIVQPNVKSRDPLRPASNNEIHLPNFSPIRTQYLKIRMSRAVNFECGKQLPFRNIHPWKQSYQATRLAKSMIFNSRFNFKLSECVGVFG